MAQQRKYAALDADVLIKLCDGDSNAQEAVDWLSSRGVYPMVTAAVIQTLMSMAVEDKVADNRAVAEKALKCLSIFGILDAPLEGVELDIARLTSLRLLESGELKDSACAEIDAMVIAEAAVQNCFILLTDSKGILDAKYDDLALILLDRHLSDVLIYSPDAIASFIRRQEEETAGGGI